MSCPGTWYWPAAPFELFYNQYTLSYQLTLATRTPLHQATLHQALHHLYRKVPILRLCFGEQEGQQWFREMEEELVDFEVIYNTNNDEIHDAILGRQHNLTTGPLWCAKLRPEPSSGDQGVRDDVPPDYPHVSTLFLGYHHAITDGTSNTLILGCLTRLIDDLIASRHINDQEQIGAFVEARKTQDLVDAAVDAMRKDAGLRKTAIDEVKNYPRAHSLVNGTYKINNKINVTRHIVKDYDQSTTAAFIKKCKDVGVSVNSAFIALCNIAIVDLVEDGGLLQDSYLIHHEFNINARRYWAGDTANTLGCHIFPLHPVFVNTHTTDRDAFWEYAKRVHQQLKKTLDDRDVIRTNAAKILLEEDKSSKQGIEMPKLPHHCFYISNLGDLTRLMNHGGKHWGSLDMFSSSNHEVNNSTSNAIITRVVRMAAQHNSPNNWAHLVHTYRDRLSHVLCYATGYVTEAIANKYVARVHHHLLKALSH